MSIVITVELTGNGCAVRTCTSLAVNALVLQLGCLVPLIIALVHGLLKSRRNIVLDIVAHRAH